MKHLSRISKALVGGGVILLLVSTLADQAAAQNCVAPPAGLVSWWPGQGNANDIADGNNGTLEGGATFATGKVGQAFSLDGVDDFVNVPDSASLDSITSAISVDMWINPLPDQGPIGGYVFSRRDPFVSEGFSLVTDNAGRLNVVVRTTTSPTVSGSIFVSSPGVITFGQFQHVAATANTTTGFVRAYVNGQEVPLLNVFGPATLSGSLFNVNHLFIGRRQSSATSEGPVFAGYYNGLIDELDVYSAELTQTRIQAIFDAGIAGKCILAPLIDQVNALVAAGVLNPGQGHSRIATLQAAIQLLDDGNVTAAINELEAFINQVNAFLNAGTLTAEQGQALIDAAQEIIAYLGG